MGRQDEKSLSRTSWLHPEQHGLSAEQKYLPDVGRSQLLSAKGSPNMDFSKFDNDTDESEENYSAYVDWLSELTANELRHVKDNPEQQKQALCRYYKRGEAANLTASELIDFLGISSPSILEMAGYGEEEGDALFVISDALTDEEISQAVLTAV